MFVNVSYLETPIGIGDISALFLIEGQFSLVGGAIQDYTNWVCKDFSIS